MAAWTTIQILESPNSIYWAPQSWSEAFLPLSVHCFGIAVNVPGARLSPWLVRVQRRVCAAPLAPSTDGEPTAGDLPDSSLDANVGFRRLWGSRVTKLESPHPSL